MFGDERSFAVIKVPNGGKEDAQGNIIALIDNSGKVVVQYVYDAWGNHAVLDANGNDLTSSSHIGNRNPFRYRGYFYDAETGLYYLQTRYYDPEVGRFLNMDDISYATPEQLHGLNLYAYCANNPVMGYDPYGTWDWGKFFGWITVIALAAVGVGLIIATGGMVAAGLIVSNGIAASTMVGAGVGIVAGISGSIMAQGGIKNLKNINPWDIAISGAIGAGIGAISGAVSFGFSQIGKHAGELLGNMLGNARHIGSGLRFSKVFCIKVNTLMKIGSVLGGAAGGMIGGMGANYFANQFVDYTIDERYEVDNPNYMRSAILKFFKWLCPISS